MGASGGGPGGVPAVPPRGLPGGILALAAMVWRGQVWGTLARAGRILLGGRARQGRGLRRAPTVPYGLAIAAGSLFAVFWRAFA